MLVDGDLVRIAGAEGDPSAVAGAEDGLERRDQAAGRDESLDVLSALDVHVGLAVRNDEQRTEGAALNADAQALGGPHRFASLAQARFFLRGGASLGEALGEVHDFLRKGREEIVRVAWGADLRGRRGYPSSTLRCGKSAG